jgi:hypothetical protein
MRRKSKRRWSDLSTAERSGVIAAASVQLGLTLAALADLRRRPAERVNGSKAVWAAVAFVNYIGPLAYFKFGRRR